MNSSFFRLASSATAVAMAISFPAEAQTRSFNIPAQPASSGVREFARQAGIRVIVAGRDTDGRTTNAVQGKLDTRDALDRLLAETGLTVRSLDGGVAILGGVSEQHAETEETVSDIQVTGTRIVRNGYDAPTPTTVLSEEEIVRKAPENIADVLTLLPAVAAGNSPAQNTGTTSSGYTGVNSLNLRNLGSSRTLVLLDGRRLPAATVNGSIVDINVIPNAFIKRVDIVTGGASAAWGSDADAGVVNFVLDKEFTGVKGKIQGGATTYGDRANYTLSLGAGARFAEGRGHVLLSVEHSYIDGIDGLPRSWYTGYRTFANPNWTATNGQPKYLSLDHVGYASITPGGVVTSGPLRGVYFGQNGTPGQLNYGSLLTSDTFVGGDWKYTDWSANTQSFLNANSRQSAFARASFDLTDKIQLFSQFIFTRSHVTSAAPPTITGSTIGIGNAFLPASIVDRMNQLGLKTLTIGSSNADLGKRTYESDHSLYQYLVGASGSFDLFGKGFTWEVSGYRSISKIGQDVLVPESAKLAKALDAVRGPNGTIVCNSTLTNPNNGCVPYNAMGTGVNSSAAAAYFMGTDWVRQTIHQDGVAGTLRGEPFSTWAGPVSIATGVEYRRDKAFGTANPIGLVDGFGNANYKPIAGSVNVTEGFMEVVVPLIEGGIFKSLDFNGAIRGTDYSSSGFVTTWKTGVTFEPIDDVKLRLTRSRDIRAGNLSELFAAGSTGSAVASDPFLGGQTYTVQQITTGNPTIRPEKADTITFGAVLTPRFIPGLSLSADYWDVRIRDAITTASGSSTVDQCFKGDQDLCDNIVRGDDGRIKYVYVRPVNLDLFWARGIDFEASYRLHLSDLSASLGSGQVMLRALGTLNLKNGSESGITGIFNSSLGEGGAPKFRYLLDIAYKNGPLDVSLTGRGLSAGVRDVTYVECSTSCPGGNNTINNNHTDGAFYIDASVGYGITKNVDGFVVVTNIANRAPIASADGPGFSSAQFGYNRTYSDTGRAFRAGIRFKL
jgi:outer membrane receptor protein involved in Fe transport